MISGSLTLNGLDDEDMRLIFEMRAKTPLLFNPCVCRKLRPFDLVTESPNVSGDDRSVVLLSDPVRL
jgi:hypothetical protein